MKFSIITVNLNNHAGLLNTIESVVNQTFTGFEFIIIDGGSNDGSREIVETFTTKLSYWVSEPDRGIYHAMNKGITKATGEYLLFLNSGDFLVDKTVMERLLKFDFCEDIVAGDCNVSEYGKVIFHATPPNEISLSAFYGRTIPHQSTFIRRELFNNIGLYSENYWIHSDLEFFIKALILKECSYRHLPLTISDYNIEGISGKGALKTISGTQEYDEILDKLIPSRILTDYANWNRYQGEMRIMNWTKSKAVFYKPLILLYNLAKWIVSFRKKLF